MNSIAKDEQCNADHEVINSPHNLRDRLDRNALAVESHANDQRKGVEDFNHPDHEAADAPSADSAPLK